MAAHPLTAGQPIRPRLPCPPSLPFPAARSWRPMPTFDTTLKQERKTATGIEVPPEVVAALGTGRKPAVTVTLNGHVYRSTVAFLSGRFMLPVSAEHRRGAGIQAGDPVSVRHRTPRGQRTWRQRRAGGKSGGPRTLRAPAVQRETPARPGGRGHQDPGDPYPARGQSRPDADGGLSGPADSECWSEGGPWGVGRPRPCASDMG